MLYFFFKQNAIRNVTVDIIVNVTALRNVTVTNKYTYLYYYLKSYSVAR